MPHPSTLQPQQSWLQVRVLYGQNVEPWKTFDECSGSWRFPAGVLTSDAAVLSHAFWVLSIGLNDFLYCGTIRTCLIENVCKIIQVQHDPSMHPSLHQSIHPSSCVPACLSIMVSLYLSLYMVIKLLVYC